MNVLNLILPIIFLALGILMLLFPDKAVDLQRKQAEKRKNRPFNFGSAERTLSVPRSQALFSTRLTGIFFILIPLYAILSQFKGKNTELDSVLYLLGYLLLPGNFPLIIGACMLVYVSRTSPEESATASTRNMKYAGIGFIIFGLIGMFFFR